MNTLIEPLSRVSPAGAAASPWHPTQSAAPASFSVQCACCGRCGTEAETEELAADRAQEAGWARGRGWFTAQQGCWLVKPWLPLEWWICPGCVE